jgi:hypothetical protein
MVPPVPDLPGSELVFSRDRQARRPLLWRSAIAVLAGALAAAAAALLGPPMLVIAGACGVAGLGYAAAYLIAGRFRTVLSPDGLHVQGYFRHFVPWSQITSFRVRDHGMPQAAVAQPEPDRDNEPRRLVPSVGRSAPFWNYAQPDSDRPSRGDRVTVEVVRAGRRRLILPAPVVSGRVGDPEFTDKVRQLERWRQRYGGVAGSNPVY